MRRLGLNDGRCTFDEFLDTGVVLSQFLQPNADVDDMCDVAFPGLVDRVTSLDLLVLLPLLRDEVQKHIVCQDGLVERRSLLLGQSNVYDPHDLVVQHVIHVVLLAQAQQRGKEVRTSSHHVLGLQNVFL